MTARYLGVSGLAAELGVTRHVVSKWRERYPQGSAHPFPAPDVEIDGVPGWAVKRVGVVRRWRSGLPGRTGRPPRDRE